MLTSPAPVGARTSTAAGRVALIVLATGAFATGTDAFVIGGILPSVARGLGVSTSSAGLLVTVFAVAYALGAPILAVIGLGRHTGSARDCRKRQRNVLTCCHPCWRR
jgi:MFS family permease